MNKLGYNERKVINTNKINILFNDYISNKNIYYNHIYFDVFLTAYLFRKNMEHFLPSETFADLL